MRILNSRAALRLASPGHSHSHQSDVKENKVVLFVFPLNVRKDENKDRYEEEKYEVNGAARLTDRLGCDL